MNNRPPDGPTFPSTHGGCSAMGMTLRDFFAAFASAGFVANGQAIGAAEAAYRLADAMLAERAK